MNSLLLAALLIPLIHALPNGAPCSQIEKMTPFHRGGEFKKKPPFRISIGASCYKPGNIIRVTLEGKEDIRHNLPPEFKGFVMQARPTCNRVEGDERLGSFLEGNGDFKYQCPGDDTSITHVWNDLKTKLEVDWVVEDDTHGEIRFIATVVKDYSEYWVRRIKSRALKPCSNPNVVCDGSGGVEQTATKSPSLESLIDRSRCNEELDRGIFCGKYQNRFYHRSGQCRHYWYQGCPENEGANSFATHEECRITCLTKPVTHAPKVEDVCVLPGSDPGVWCKPPGGKDYWSYTDGKCVLFHYLGCQGNDNKFTTEAECVDACITRGCSRLRDDEQFCESWAKSNNLLCSETSGSEVVRNKCKRSCCRFYGSPR